MVRKILSVPSVRLRLKSEEVKKEDIADLSALFKDLRDTLDLQGDKGLGLAAPQINVRKRVILAKVIHSSSAKPVPTIFINPIITASEGTFKSVEGCFSVPGQYKEVERLQIITLSYIDEQSEDRTAILYDREAVLLQHEIDHLDGVLFIDRIKNVINEQII